MADQLQEILNISKKHAESLLEMSGGKVDVAMNIYLQTQSSPEGRAAGSAAAAPAPVAPPQAVAAQAQLAAQDPVQVEEEEEFTIKEPGKTIRIRCRAPNGQHDMSVDEGMPMGLFLKEIGTKAEIPPGSVKMLMGFPPKALEIDDLWKTLKDMGLRSGEQLTVQKGEDSGKVMKGTIKGKYIPPTDSKNSFTKREMPGDNSCLFHACNYVLHNKTRGDPMKLRDEIAEEVLSFPGKYTTDFLGQPNAHYAAWIRHKDNWGGAIELSILSAHYETEIVALDIQTKRCYQYGEDKNYTTRCFILYSGRHYDAMAMAEYGGAPDGKDLVQFSTTDKNVFKKALDFIDMEHKRALANPQ